MPLLVAVAAILFVGYSALIWNNIVYAVGGSDSSGYFNAAKMFAAGKTTRAIPVPPELGPKDHWAFIPLGFVARKSSTTMASVCPSGLPLHMVAAASIAGWDRGPFLVAPLAMLATILFVLLLALRFARAEVALFAAACLAGCAVFIFMGIQPMSDVVATLWCTAAAAACLWKGGEVAPAVAAGVALGLAALVRPISLLMVLPMLLFLRPRQYRWAVVGGLPFALLLFWYNYKTFGSPLADGYITGGTIREFRLTDAADRAGLYLLRTTRQLGPFVLPMSLVSLWIPYAPFRIRAGFFLWFTAFLVSCSLFDVNGAWWYTRYLLPAYPALLIMTAAGIESMLRQRTWPMGIMAGSIATISLALIITTTSRLDVFFIDEGEMKHRRAGEWLAQNLPKYSLLVTIHMSGAALAYTTHFPVHWDRAGKEELDQWIRTSADHGRGTWAVLFPHEVPEFRSRHGDPGPVVQELPNYQVFRLDSARR